MKPGLFSTSTIFFRRGTGTAVAPELLFVVQSPFTSVRTTPVFRLSNQSAGAQDATILSSAPEQGYILSMHRGGMRSGYNNVYTVPMYK